MIKDPLNNENPYEILGLTPKATREEINKSLSAFMKDMKNRGRIRDAQTARGILLDSEKRLEVDMLMYEADDINLEKLQSVDIPSVVDNLLEIPFLQDSELYTDLDSENLEAEMEVIPDYQPAFNDDGCFEDSDLKKMSDTIITFDL